MKKIICCLLACLGLLPAAAQNSEHNAEVTRQLEIFNTLYRQLDQYYVDTLDASKQIENAINYMLAQLDPYTVYYNEEKVDELKQMTTGKYAGIGSLISYNKAADRCVISDPYEHMPAAEGGLRRGDIILSIDGKDIGVCGKRDRGEYSSEVSNALRGDPGTTLNIVVKRPYVADSLHFSITRKNISLPSVVYTGMLADSVGYVLLNGYTENTSRDVRHAFESLKEKGARRLILDLRDNGGGLMLEAVNIVNLFIPKGLPVVSIKGKLPQMNATYKTRQDPWDTQIPLAILTDFGTASAAEITCGALQDYDRAIVLGRRTYGKGLVQQSRPLDYQTALKLTTSKYYIPSGRCIQAYEFSNGMPKFRPDSLSKEFHTAAGRPVRDGGGITPDVIIEADSLPSLRTALERSVPLFDYSVKYSNTHKSIASPSQFHISDQDYADFRAFLKQEKFTYDSQSRNALSLLRKIAEREGYGEVAKAEFDALEAKLVHNEEHDFKHWEKEIRQLVDMAILRSNYYEKGAIEYFLPHDKDLQEALTILCDDARYRSILSSPKKK